MPQPIAGCWPLRCEKILPPKDAKKSLSTPAALNYCIAALKSLNPLENKGFSENPSRNKITWYFPNGAQGRRAL